MTTNEPERVTSADVSQLSSDTRDLTASVDRLADRQTATERNVEANQQTVDAILELQKGRRTNRRLAVAALVLVLVGILFAINSNRQLIADQDTDRKSRSQGSCVQSNVTTERQREALIRGIVDTFPQVAPAEPRLRENVERLLPYRDCSQAGIDAYLEDPPPDPNAP